MVHSGFPGSTTDGFSVIEPLVIGQLSVRDDAKEKRTTAVEPIPETRISVTRIIGIPKFENFNLANSNSEGEIN